MAATRPFVLLVHAGAGNHGTTHDEDYERVLRRACQRGHKALVADGGSPTAAVAAAIRVLEDNPICNAGRGSSLNADGKVECDASIMSGDDGSFGACAATAGVCNPIDLAERLRHAQSQPLPGGLVNPIMLAGPGAERWARAHGVECCDPSKHVTEQRTKQWEIYRSYTETSPQLDDSSEAPPRKVPRREEPAEAPAQKRIFDTVGAICVDSTLSVAAGVSSGGLWLKPPGRVGEAALYGAGCWAADGGEEHAGVACSVSGIGEQVTQAQLAQRVARALAVASADDGAHGAALAELRDGFAARMGPSHLPPTAGFVACRAEPADTDGPPSVELVWGHNTPSLAVGYYHHKRSAPRAVISRSDSVSVSGVWVDFGESGG